MTTVFDQRIVQVSIEFEDGTQTFEGLSIYATGQKVDAAAMNQCECRIFNLTKEQRNYILSRTSPLNLNRRPIIMTLDVGRESYGTFRLFDGYVISSGSTQPPDIGITLTALTNSFSTGIILRNIQSSIAQLRTIAQSIAENNGKILDFQATDKQIQNFMYNGCAAYQIRDLNEMGGIIASIDGNVLTVRDADKPDKALPRLISATTGMVGIPQFTAAGINVRMMIDNTIKLGGIVNIISEEVPAANGSWVVQKILFEVASRDQPFFYTLDCKVPAYYAGQIG